MASDILSAMITPVGLMSGTGLFLLTSNNRMGRVVDRIRQLNAALEAQREEPESERRTFLVERYLAQIDILERRGRSLKWALMALHGGFSCFLASSLLLALLLPFELRWPAVAAACLGMAALFYAAVSLTAEIGNSFLAVQIDLEIGRSAHPLDRKKA
jgi:Protein of unknown function (DUF2721)